MFSNCIVILYNQTYDLYNKNIPQQWSDEPDTTLRCYGQAWPFSIIDLDSPSGRKVYAAQVGWKIICKMEGNGL